MAWLKIDDAFLEDETVLLLKHTTYRLHVSGMIYCARNLTDGLLTDRAVKVLQAILGFNAKNNVAELVESGLWIPADGGHRVKNFLKYNPSAENVKESRARNAERQARHRDRTNADSNDTRNGVTNDAPSPPLPSRKETHLSALTSYEGGHIDESLRKLALATGVKTRGDSDKLIRTVRSRKSTEHDIASAIEAATGPGVRDRLAVALAELVKRSNDRRSTAA